jgi:hypothetical protein
VAGASERGTLDSTVAGPPLPGRVRADAARVAEAMMPGVPEEAVMRAFVAWTQLFGSISFELFGQLEGGVEERDGFFDQCVGLMAEFVGLGAPGALDRRGQRRGKARSA